MSKRPATEAARVSLQSFLRLHFPQHRATIALRQSPDNEGGNPPMEEAGSLFPRRRA